MESSVASCVGLFLGGVEVLEHLRVGEVACAI